MWEIVTNFAFGLVKTSICCALMRLAVQRPYRVSLWILIIITWAISTWGVIASATTYHPSYEICVTGPNPGCSSFTSLPAVLQLAIYAAVDAACTIMPVLLLWDLQMGTGAGLSIVTLLGLGSF